MKTVLNLRNVLPAVSKVKSLDKRNMLFTSDLMTSSLITVIKRDREREREINWRPKSVP